MEKDRHNKVQNVQTAAVYGGWKGIVTIKYGMCKQQQFTAGWKGIVTIKYRMCKQLQFTAGWKGIVTIKYRMYRKCTR